jgi:hypothetical protein
MNLEQIRNDKNDKSAWRPESVNVLRNQLRIADATANEIVAQQHFEIM